MKKLIAILPGLLIASSGSLYAADELNERACNLQGREVALRISEELTGDISASDRNRMAEIAEAVCMDYQAATGMTGDAGSPAMPVVGRPGAQAITEPPVNDTVTSDSESEAEAGEDEDESGLLGNIRIIDPEDRVRRPGLKRR